MMMELQRKMQYFLFFLKVILRTAWQLSVNIIKKCHICRKSMNLSIDMSEKQTISFHWVHSTKHFICYLFLSFLVDVIPRMFQFVLVRIRFFLLRILILFPPDNILVSVCFSMCNTLKCFSKWYCFIFSKRKSCVCVDQSNYWIGFIDVLFFLSEEINLKPTQNGSS